MGYIKNLEQFLFYFLFFAIPFQTRIILYSPGWYFNEWQAISVYATDIILLTLFVFWLFNSYSKLSYYVLRITYYGKNLKSLIRNTKYPVRARGPLGFSGLLLKPDFYLVLFLVVAGISVKNSSDFFVGAFLWLKSVEFALFYFYLKNYAIKKFNFVKILYALIIGGVFQAVIAIGQFLKQGDLGLRWLGESVLGPHMTGIASFYTFVGDKVIRAYGTAPHPNVLAAYLFLAIFSFYFIFLYKNRFCTHILIYGYSGYVLLLVGLFFTFSRAIIFLWGVGFLVSGLIIVVKNKFREQFWRGFVFKKPLMNHAGGRLYDTMICHKKLIQVVVVTVLAVVAFSVLYWPEVQSRMTFSSEEEAMQLRVFYNKESLEGGINLFGIGLGDFTGWLMEQNPNLPSYMYQPVHNIYLFMYKEVGVIGFVLFLLFIAGLLYEFIKKVIHRPTSQVGYPQGVLLVVASVLFMGLFDHFLFTLQQGRFVFWITLALLGILAPSLNKHKVESGD